MIEIEIDGKKISAQEGSMVIEAADAAGIYIPRFCYHKKLTIAANCRMCLVEVEKSKKPLPACATPVTNGLKVFTKSQMSLDAQRSVMEFLLINHPLDCPICDQGGECELQDLSMGYGRDISRFNLGKRSVVDEDFGPLIATEMTRCIQCTRCVRFSTEVAGMPELGATFRGEDLKIRAYVRHTLESELSGNIIELCPVGALTSKPFRFTARAWELKQLPSIAPHDCIGSNIYVHTRGHEYKDYQEVMRVVPKDNEAINETWLSDRDRFSYEAIYHPNRLLKPKIKQNDQWLEVDWSTALNFVVDQLQHIIKTSGADQIAALASPSSTVEEFYLLQKLMRSMGSQNLDHRIRQTDFSQQENFPLFPDLGIKLKEIENQQVILLIGSNIRQEQPLGCHRVRKAALKGAKVMAINPIDYDFNLPLHQKNILPSDKIPDALVEILKALSSKKKTKSGELPQFLDEISPSAIAKEMATHLQKGQQVLILLGPHAINHPEATIILALARQIAAMTGANLGSLSEGSNSAGGWLAGMVPHRDAGGVAIPNPGLSAEAMFEEVRQAYLLLNLEPEFDCSKPAMILEALQNAKLVVCLTPFFNEQQAKYATVLLPITPFFETSGTFINAEGIWQTFQAVTPPMNDSRPAWKVFRVLGNLFKFEGFDYNDVDQIYAEVKSLADTIAPKNDSLKLPENLIPAVSLIRRLSEWPRYHIDNLTRRAKALQTWESLQKNLVSIRMNSQLAQKLHVRTGELISASQNGRVIDLPVAVDDRIAGDYVVLPAGIDMTEGFGENFGAITLLRGDERD